MPCNKNRIYLLWSGELAPDDQRQVRHHLETCSACRQLLSELQMLKGKVDQLPEVSAPKRLLPSAFEKATPAKRPWWRFPVPLWQVALVMCLALALGQILPNLSLQRKADSLDLEVLASFPVSSPVTPVDDRLKILQARFDTFRPKPHQRSHRRFFPARTPAVDQKLARLNKRVKALPKARGRHRLVSL